jgi:hypothetical protein
MSNPRATALAILAGNGQRELAERLIWDRMSGTKLRKNKSYSSNRYY